MLPTPEAYSKRFTKAEIRQSWIARAEAMGKLIKKHKAKYEKVEKETGVPWQLVGCLHALESSLDFNTWLANGDPLTGPTRNVPAGLTLPGNPPWDWTEAAIKSLKLGDFHKRSFAKLGDLLQAAEVYNGTGYLNGAGRATTPPSTSPYLWSGTTEYLKGKYVSDGKFDSEAVSQQVGVAAILKVLGFGEITKVTWFEIFRTGETNVIVGYDGPVALVKLETTEIRLLIDLLQRSPTAASFRVAPVGKAIPELGESDLPVPPTPKPFNTPFFRLTRDRQINRPDGMEQLNLQVVNHLREVVGVFKVVSGIQGAQMFRKGSSSVRGSMEPLPEGKYKVGVIEWADVKDNYDASWGTGLGPAWMSLTPLFATMRSAIGIHIDTNVLGTAGCVGFPNEAEFRRFVELIRIPANDGAFLYCDWGLGSCPPESD